MKSLKALFTVLFALSIVFVLAWFYLRMKGASTQHPDFDNPFFSANSFKGEKHQLIALRGESTHFPENSMAAFAAAANLSPKVILWMDILLTKDHVLVASRNQDVDPAAPPQTPHWIAILDWADIDKRGLGLVKVEDVLKKFPQQRFILNLCDDTGGIERVLAESLGYHDAGSRFLIQSERDRILKEARKLTPMLLFGSSSPQVTQLLLLSQMRLEMAAPLNSDILIVEKSVDKKHELLNDAMISEAHRRGLKVFAGDPILLPDAQALLSRGVDGIITPDPSALLSTIQ